MQRGIRSTAVGPLAALPPPLDCSVTADGDPHPLAGVRTHGTPRSVLVDASQIDEMSF